MAKTSIKIEGGSISKEFISSHATEADFITAMQGDTYKHLFEGKNRDAKLKEVYAKYQPKEAEAPQKTAPAKGAKQ